MHQIHFWARTRGNRMGGRADCVLFWLVSVTPWKSRFLPSKSRKVKKSKSRKVHLAGDFGSKSRKNRKIRKIRKVEKSKSRKNRTIRKNRKVEKSIFLFFCENFPERVMNPVRFWRHWSTGSIHAQGFFMVVWLLFPGWIVGYFPGEQETCNQCISIRFCVAHVVGFCIFCVDFVGFESWILKTHKIAEQVWVEKSRELAVA